VTDRRLDLVLRLQALARTGLHFCGSEYDRQRYEEIERIAAELAAGGRPADRDVLLALWRQETGYVTPKVEVRGASFRDGRVLLVRETADGHWTLPGGWADVGESPSQSIEKEIEQESGFRARAVKLAALYDRSRHGHGETRSPAGRRSSSASSAAARPAAATRPTRSASSTRRTCRRCRSGAARHARWRACSSTGAIARCPPTSTRAPPIVRPLGA
jgi:ADP-ribose pyrophosphatase YjhB (NUDIX family)